MKRKIALTLVSIALISLASFAFENVARVNAGGSKSYRYVLMGGIAPCTAELYVGLLGGHQNISTVPFTTRPPDFTPGEISFNITFSDPDPTTGVVDLFVDNDTYQGFNHVFWDNVTGMCFNTTVTMKGEDGYGWLFTGNGTLPEFDYTNPAWAVDVDMITFNNNTGVYFYGPDGLNGTADDSPATPGLWDLGADGIPGTGDDDFGDGTPDPAGSSVLYIPTYMDVYEWEYELGWQPFYTAPFPQVFTTATSNDTVLEPSSMLYPGPPVGKCENRPDAPLSGEAEGHPWRCPDVFVKYACVWSSLEIMTTTGPLDLHFIMTTTLIKENLYDFLKGDADLNQLVDMRDIGMACGAYGSYDEGLLTPYAHPKFDARTDCDMNSLVDMRDIGIMCGNYGNEFTCP